MTKLPTLPATVVYPWGSRGEAVTLAEIVSCTYQYREAVVNLDVVDNGRITINGVLEFQPYSLLQFLKWWRGTSRTFTEFSTWWLQVLENEVGIAVSDRKLRIMLFRCGAPELWQSQCLTNTYGFARPITSVPTELPVLHETVISQDDWQQCGDKVSADYKVLLSLLPRDARGHFQFENEDAELEREALAYIHEESQ